MKKLVIICVILSFSIFAKENQLKYEDVPKNHWAYNAINNLVEKGIITENSFLFKGDFPVSRYSFAEGLNRVLVELDEKKANRGDLVILESLVYEFSRELTKIGFDADTFSGKIENIKIDIEILKESNSETQLKIKELEKRIKNLEN